MRVTLLVLGMVLGLGLVGLADDGSVPYPIDEDRGGQLQGIIICEIPPICTACCGQRCISVWWCVAYCAPQFPWGMPVPDAWEAGDLYYCYDPVSGRWAHYCFDITFQGCLCAFCAMWLDQGPVDYPRHQ